MQTEAKCVTYCRGAAKCFVTSCLGEWEHSMCSEKKSHLYSVHGAPSLTDM